MLTQDSNNILSNNTPILSSVCLLLPAAAMAGAHWFPWRRLLGRDLHRPEAYLIGTTSIVGTAALAILNSRGSRDDHAALLLLAALGAGSMTLVAYGLDEIVRLRGQVANLRGQKDLLRHDDL